MKRLLLIVAAALLPPASAWSQTVVQTVVNDFTAASGNVTFGSNTTTGNLIQCTAYVYADSGTVTAAASDNKSNTYTSAIRQGSAGSPDRIFVENFYIANATGGASHQVTVDLTGATGPQWAIGCAEISGAAISSVVAGTDGDNSNTSTPTATIASTSPSASGLLIASVASFFQNANFTAGSGFTEHFEHDATGESYSFESKTYSTTGPHTCDFTSSVTDFQIVTCVAYKVAEAAPTGSSRRAFGFKK